MRIHVNYHHEGLIDFEDPGVVERNLIYSEDQGEVGKPREMLRRKPDPRGSTEYLHPKILNQGEKKAEFALQWKSVEGVRKLEDESDENPIYVFSLNTKERATPGDYTIDLVFTYLNGGTIDQSCAESNVHVNDWREQKEPYVTYGAFLAVAIAVLSFLVQLITAIVPTIG